MATQIRSYSSVDPSAAIARALTKAMSRRSSSWPFVKDISEIFFNLRQAGIRFKGMGLRRIPDGFYSEDVEVFVGQLLSMGYATQRSPINLEEEGLKLCAEIWAKEEKVQRNNAEVLKLREEIDRLVAKSPVPAS